jgi:predicted nuclease of restriction endonuclease-like (RecB) superfamily
MSKSKSIVPVDYAEFLTGLKERIRDSRTTAVRAVNRELVLLYWDIGRAIAEKQKTANWGDGVVEQVAIDLRAEFPDMRGFSKQNVWRMKQLYLDYTSDEFLSQAVRELEYLPKTGKPNVLLQAEAELGDRKDVSHPAPEFLSQAVRELVAAVPWGHHANVLAKLTDPAIRLWYLHATAQFGWSRHVLLNQIKANAYERSVTEDKTHNFAVALPEHFAEQADEMMKSRYNLEFLGIAGAVRERELENGLIEKLQTFILELGYGFCFVGRQFRLALGEKEYFVDLLFYHRFLKSLVAFDLKIGSFEPEHAGKMDFYLNLLNDTQRAHDDQSSIGIILCAEKSDIEVEYSLKSKSNPIGVAEYQLQTRLPDEFKGKLPTAKQLSDAVRRALPENNETP